ncbi:carboxyltransferase domain-containing protein [Jiella sp. MQZ9-1]|uniref:Carboxyltransferase domain-containing protein n=1 Tax=Jiella flava TaxID=2816857 RepID=A0A939FTT1_9HYPH|nr:carboxyltransferase domain-containing protein [Jiella flava]MBO0661422.1 carboxyltransferase domain-containing protein [Jiella flava]MCD2470065.1 carboxyltransferase domain-containing protein [Jiella flava]
MTLLNGDLLRTSTEEAGEDMIYDQPRFMPAGDRYVLIEFGNEMNLDLNFLAQGLATAAANAEIGGVIETAPCFASLLVHYEPTQIGYDDVVREFLQLSAALGSSEDIELESRLFYLPALYLDPWTKACVDDYCAKIAKKAPDAELVVQENGLDNVEHLVRLHSSSEYWVASLGFWPGLPFLMALDPRARLTAPKYNPPRTNTPKGAIGLGGAANSIYPVATPGGYQIFARTPVPIWDPTGRQEVFEGSLCLFRPGDRIKFVPVTRDEYDACEAALNDGRYSYTVVEYQKFGVRNYKKWVSKLDKKTGAAA